jgi:hypothetical protein
VSFTTCEVSGARREGTALGATAPAGEGVHTREGQPHHAIHAVDATQAWVDGGGLTTPPPPGTHRTPPGPPPPFPVHIPHSHFPLHTYLSHSATTSRPHATLPFSYVSTTSESPLHCFSFMA